MPAQEVRVSEIPQLFKDAEQRGNRVLLEGLAAVAEAASKLIEVQGVLIREVQAFGQAHAASADDADQRAGAAEASGLTYLAAHRKFIDAARAALDEVIDAC